MPIDPSDVHPATFAPHVGTAFTVTLDDGQTVALELKKVEDLPVFPGQPRPDPFTLWFAGPAGVYLEQATYHLDHDELGGLDIFLIPRQPGADGLSQFEAVFN
jgi:hypothetical protein